MKIEQIDLYHIALPLVTPFGSSQGVQQQQEALLVALHSEGLTGWGECLVGSPPQRSPETAVSAWHILSDFLIPPLLSQPLQEPEQLPAWHSHICGHPQAKAALQLAAWDLTAQRDGLSLAQKLAQPYPESPRQRVPVCATVGTVAPFAHTISTIQTYLAQGYGRINLKIMPGRDIKLTWKVRHTLPNAPITLDANAAYTPEDTVVFEAIDELNFVLIEQPFGRDDFCGHSELRDQIQTPLSLDESIRSLDMARTALALNACNRLNINPAQVGGLVQARQIYELAVAHGVELGVGGQLETAIGRAAQLAFAALPNISHPCDMSATAHYYAQDIGTPFILNPEDGTITVPTRLGLGIELDAARLKAVTLRQAQFS